MFSNVLKWKKIIFLKKLYKNELPFKQKYIDITKKILTVEQTKDYTIREKTITSTYTSI